RAREVAVRSALGASRTRLVRQVLTESLVLSSVGGCLGLAIAWWGTRQLLGMIGPGLPRAGVVRVDWRVLLFSPGSHPAAGIATGIAPSILAGRGQPVSVLQASNAQSTMPAGSTRLRDSLAIAEVALAFMLAVGASVLIRELVRLSHTESGMV